MNAFKKSSKILWKKNKLWIVLMALFFLLFSYTLSSGAANSYVYMISWRITEEMQRVDHGNGYEDVYMGNSEAQEAKKKEMQKLGITQKDLQDLAKKSSEEDVKEEFFLKQFDLVNKGDDYKVLGAQVIKDNLVVTLAIGAVLLAFLFSSLEHITPFYRFNRSLPWAKKYDYFAKLLMGLGILLLFTAIAYSLGFLALTRSPLRNVMVYEGMWRAIRQTVVGISSLYIFIFAIGQLAGSFLGHMGLSFIGAAGLGLVQLILVGLNVIFYDGKMSWLFNLSDSFDRFLGNLPTLVQYVLRPVSGFSSMEEGVIVLAVIYGILGYFFHKNQKVENSGKFILESRIEKVVFFLAVLVTATALGAILFSGLVAINSIAIRIIGFLFFGFVSYKIYKKLFDVRIIV